MDVKAFARRLHLLSTVDPLALTAGACTLEGNHIGVLPEPKPGFRWEYTGKPRAWPQHRSLFVQKYAGSLVGVA